MIAENRESFERDCKQFLEQYLRQEASYDALMDEATRTAFRERLFFTAKDWYQRRGVSTNVNACEQLADDAINTYLANWKGKTPGEDDRGHRLGKSS